MKIRNSKQKSVRGAVYKIVSSDAKKSQNIDSNIDLNQSQRESAVRRHTDTDKQQLTYKMEPKRKDSYLSQTSQGRRRLIGKPS